MSEPVQLKFSEIAELRAKLLVKQNGVCPMCKRKVVKENLDHSHLTGLVRATLCRGCNMYLGKIENNAVRNGIPMKLVPDVLRNTAVYLEQPHLPYIHPTEKPKEPKFSKLEFNKMKKWYLLKFPKRKALVYPKSGKLTKVLQDIYEEYKKDKID